MFTMRTAHSGEKYIFIRKTKKQQKKNPMLSLLYLKDISVSGSIMIYHTTTPYASIVTPVAHGDD